MPSPLQDVDMWLVDSLVIPASLHDVEGRFMRVNEAAERASGKSNAEWLGHHFTEPLPPEARESVAAHFRRAVERGEPTDFETVFVDASGLRSLFSELHVHTRPEAIAAAQRLGLLAPQALGPQPPDPGADTG